jgi:hypothetical protein
MSVSWPSREIRGPPRMSEGYSVGGRPSVGTERASAIELGVRFSTQPYPARTSPCDSQSYDAPKVCFSATVGEEPEIEVGLV